MLTRCPRHPCRILVHEDNDSMNQRSTAYYSDTWFFFATGKNSLNATKKPYLGVSKKRFLKVGYNQLEEGDIKRSKEEKDRKGKI